MNIQLVYHSNTLFFTQGQIDTKRYRKNGRAHRRVDKEIHVTDSNNGKPELALTVPTTEENINKIAEMVVMELLPKITGFFEQTISNILGELLPELVKTMTHNSV